MNPQCIMKHPKMNTYKMIIQILPLPDDICFTISKFVGKDVKVQEIPRWVRLKYPNEKRLVRVYY